MSWTTDDLLTSIKNCQMFPDASEGSLSPDALLQYATDGLYMTILPAIQGVREKFYEKSFDTSYTSSTTSIPIPSRAIANTVSYVQFIVGVAVAPLYPIDPGTIATIQPTAWPTNFYFQNNDIVFYPPPSGAQGTVRIGYGQRPNRLAQTSACAQISSFNANAKTVTCASVPDDWTTSDVFDFVPANANKATPYGLDSVITSVTTTVITFDDDLPDDIAVGDWVSIAQYTPIPEIPFEFQTALAQAAAYRALGALNDPTGLANAKVALDEYLKAAVLLITPRDMQGLKKVVSSWRLY